MPEELFDIYDDNGVHLGSKPRSAVHRDGDWHRVFHCWIVDPRGYLLVQQRSPNKDLFPNKLDITAAGHYSAGEVMRDGVREVEEEMGLKVAFEELVPLGLRISIKRDGTLIDRELADVFFYRSNRDLTEYRLQEEEVSGLIAFPIHEGIALFKGQCDSVLAEGLWRDDTGVYQREQRPITRDMFIETLDAYALKILILARSFLRGEADLYI
jgi:isopentenyldiphosphate isomerase